MRTSTPKNASLSSEPYVAAVLPPLTTFLPAAKPSGIGKVGVVLVLVVVVVERTYCLTKGNVVFFSFPPIFFFWVGSSEP